MESKTFDFIDAAIGLNDIDHAKPSNYFNDLISNEDIDPKYIEKMLMIYYLNNDSNIKNYICDITSIRMLKLFLNSEFELNTEFFKYIHEEIFKDLDLGIPGFKAGEFRKVNLSFKEKILNFESVIYADYKMIEDSLNYDFLKELQKKIKEYDIVKKLNSLAKFNSNIWQVHAFKNGNTRTVAVFMMLYLKSLGIEFDNSAFSTNSFYYRNALVRSNYYNSEKSIKSDYGYLIKFYENLLLGKNNLLRSSDLIVPELWEENKPNDIKEIIRK